MPGSGCFIAKNLFLKVLHEQRYFSGKLNFIQSSSKL